MQKFLEFVSRPKGVGVLVLGVVLGVWVLTVMADIWRAQDVDLMPVYVLGFLGVVLMLGWVLDRVRIGRGGVDIDIDQGGDDASE